MMRGSLLKRRRAQGADKDAEQDVMQCCMEEQDLTACPGYL